MKCQVCQHDNLERARFCIECGTAFAGRCSTCYTELPPNAKFCLQCGAAQEQNNADPADMSGDLLPLQAPRGSTSKRGLTQDLTSREAPEAEH